MNKKLSITDVAKALNVSKTTVSFILNGHSIQKRISHQLAKQVLQFVEEVGYKPNQIAKSLRTGKTNLISLIIDDIANPYFAKIASVIEKRAYEQGYAIICSSSKNSVIEMQRLIAMVCDSHVEGCIISVGHNMKREVISSLINSGLPVVMFDQYMSGSKVNYVVTDNENCAYNATCQLIKEGYSKITYITFYSSQPDTVDRIKGYMRAIKEKKIASRLMRVKFSRDENDIKKSLASILKKCHGADAVIFGNAALCRNGLKILKQEEVIVPDDLAVVSFDDCEAFQMHSPAITAIAPPADVIANEAFKLLLATIRGERNISSNITVQAGLIVRESSRANVLAPKAGLKPLYKII